MLVSTRLWVGVILFASACADTPDEGEGGSDEVKLQCSTPLSCPAPSSSSKQTICGQLYDLTTNQSLGGSVGHKCNQVTTDGPCSLGIEAYDAIAFGTNPVTSAPLAHGAVDIDSCGRFRISDVDVTSIGPFVALAVDDVAQPGPAGTTVSVVVATPRSGGTATDGVEAWVVSESTTTLWSSSGGPPLAGGVFVPMFRAHKLGTLQTDPRQPQSGVTFSTVATVEDYYFAAASMDRTTIDTTAVATGANGTALVVGASITDAVVYGGTGGLDAAKCRWEMHAAMTVPNSVFVQIFRPADVLGETCPL